MAFIYHGICYGTEFTREYETEDEAVAMAEYDADAGNSCDQWVEGPDGARINVGVLDDRWR